MFKKLFIVLVALVPGYAHAAQQTTWNIDAPEFVSGQLQQPAYIGQGFRGNYTRSQRNEPSQPFLTIQVRPGYAPQIISEQLPCPLQQPPVYSDQSFRGPYNVQPVITPPYKEFNPGQTRLSKNDVDIIRALEANSLDAMWNIIQQTNSLTHYQVLVKRTYLYAQYYNNYDKFLMLMDATFNNQCNSNLNPNSIKDHIATYISGNNYLKQYHFNSMRQRQSNHVRAPIQTVHTPQNSIKQPIELQESFPLENDIRKALLTPKRDEICNLLRKSLIQINNVDQYGKWYCACNSFYDLDQLMIEIIYPILPDLNSQALQYINNQQPTLLDNLLSQALQKDDCGRISKILEQMPFAKIKEKCKKSVVLPLAKAVLQIKPSLDNNNDLETKQQHILNYAFATNDQWIIIPILKSLKQNTVSHNVSMAVIDKLIRTHEIIDTECCRFRYIQELIGYLQIHEIPSEKFNIWLNKVICDHNIELFNILLSNRKCNNNDCSMFLYNVIKAFQQPNSTDLFEEKDEIKKQQKIELRRTKSKEMVDILLQQDFNIDQSFDYDGNQQTVLFSLLNNAYNPIRDGELLSKLLQRGADPLLGCKQSDGEEISCLVAATKKQQPEAIRLMLQYCKEPLSVTLNSIKAACRGWLETQSSISDVMKKSLQQVLIDSRDLAQKRFIGISELNREALKGNSDSDSITPKIHTPYNGEASFRGTPHDDNQFDSTDESELLLLSALQEYNMPATNTSTPPPSYSRTSNDSLYCAGSQRSDSRQTVTPPPVEDGSPRIATPKTPSIKTSNKLWNSFVSDVPQLIQSQSQIPNTLAQTFTIARVGLSHILCGDRNGGGHTQYGLSKLPQSVGIDGVAVQGSFCGELVKIKRNNTSEPKGVFPSRWTFRTIMQRILASKFKSQFIDRNNNDTVVISQVEDTEYPGLLKVVMCSPEKGSTQHCIKTAYPITQEDAKKYQSNTPPPAPLASHTPTTSMTPGGRTTPVGGQLLKPSPNKRLS